MDNQTVNSEVSNAPVSETVAAIRQEAQRNEVFGAICYSFAQRLRTKETLTLRGLKARMEAQGADFKREEYEHALKFLADLGLGSIKKDKNGAISALSNLKVTLQSIGQASGLRIKQLKPFHQQRRFQTLVPKQTPVMQAPKAAVAKKQYTAHLSISIDGNPVSFPGPIILAPEELGEFLIEFSHMTKKIGKS